MANKRTIIGKTAPVPLGQQKAVNSLPVVFAEDQPAIPVEEQNKIQSEVALSLLGIPRAEVALGIFADVNTYDINPSEWSQFPVENVLDNNNNTTVGLNHLKEEAGAELVAAEGKTTILTSKRFFRYQPGRVSSSTMGVKMNTTANTQELSDSTSSSDQEKSATMKGAPSIKKWGIFDKFDGYYFEVANGGQENDFRCVRRTQALSYDEPAGVNSTSEAWNAVVENVTGKESNIRSGNWGVFGEDPVIFRNGLCYISAAINDPSLVYDPADVNAIRQGADLNDYEYNADFALRLAYRDGGSIVEHMSGRHYQFPFDQKEIDKASSTYLGWETSENAGVSKFLKPETEYIRLDAHCKWQDILTNLSRGGDGGTSGTNTDFTQELTIDSSSDIHRVGYGDGSEIDSTHARWGMDPKPDENNSGSKVWNLLVTTQSGNLPGTTEFTQLAGTHRDSAFAYDPSDTGVSNKGQYNLTLKEWFKCCVPEEYRKVYEWRPVRAMFSGDQLNGSQNVSRWSDVSTANVDPTVLGTKRPGDPVKLDGEDLTSQSAYDVDFEKVTMWKIDFSWYGAVGALFLCYVPVGNGEARWVRVHHMRASNQLDVASLGNATLPITYLTHGGLQSGLSQGNRLIKYGASYYIDGGDKGTVKLLSKSTDYPKPVPFGQFIGTVAGVPPSSNSIKVDVGDATFAQREHDQFIGSYLKSDTTRSVIWTKFDTGTTIQLFFNADHGLSDTNVFNLVVPRKQRAQLALRAKDNVINTSGKAIRNRIQLYPLKYGVGLTDNSSTYENIVSLNFIKNPLLITNNLNNTNVGAGSSSYGNLSNSTDYVEVYSDNTNTSTKAKGLNMGSGTVPVEIVDGTNTGALADWTATALLNTPGKYFYAYARGLDTESAASGFPVEANITVQEFPALVRVYRDVSNSKVYIQNYEAYANDISIHGPLKFVNMYEYGTTGQLTRFTGTVGSASGNHSKFENQRKWDASEVGTWESIAALSGAKVSQDFKLAPVANTGSNVFSIYANKGGASYDLSDYFAYNKEYISFPLTNEVDILGVYANWESTSKAITAPGDSPTNTIEIVNSLTWEEQ